MRQHEDGSKARLSARCVTCKPARENSTSMIAIERMVKQAAGYGAQICGKHLFSYLRRGAKRRGQRTNQFRGSWGLKSVTIRAAIHDLGMEWLPASKSSACACARASRASTICARLRE